MGGNNKIAPLNGFAQVKSFSCNRRCEATNLILEKSLVLEEMDFWGENERAQKKVFAQFHLRAIQEIRSKSSKSRIQCMPKTVLSRTVGNY
jgi:hypothetical protein